MQTDSTTYDVFISYRRDKGKYIARGLQLALEKLGLKVFFDMEELTDGKFNEKIYTAIDRSKNLVFLMTEGALDRCVNDGDWIRNELEHAVEKGVNLVPIAPTGTPIRFPEGLPEKLAPLRFLEVSELNLEKLFKQSLIAISTRFKGVAIAGDDAKREAEKKAAEETFLAQARRLKRNDGIIDDEERKQLDCTARELGISVVRKIALIERVEREFLEGGTPPETGQRSARAKSTRRGPRSGERKKTGRQGPSRRSGQSGGSTDETGSAPQPLPPPDAFAAMPETTAHRNAPEGKTGDAGRAPMGTFDKVMCVLVSLFAGLMTCLLFLVGHWVLGTLTLIVLAGAHIGLHGSCSGLKSRQAWWAWMFMGMLLFIGSCLGLEGHWFWGTLFILVSAGCVLENAG